MVGLCFLYFSRRVNSTYFNVDWHYDFKNIEIQRTNDIVTIILTDDMEITVSYDANKSNMQSQTSALAKEYSAEEINALIKALQDKVIDKVQVDGNMYDEAYTSLENVLRGICEKMGFKNIIVEFKGE